MRSTLYDLSRVNYHFADKDIVHLIEKIESVEFEVSHLSPEEMSWFDFFEKNEMIKLVPDSCFDLFTDVSENYSTPSIISNVVLSINADLSSWHEQLFDLGCRHILIEVNHPPTDSDAASLLIFEKTHLKSVELYISTYFSELRDFIRSCKKLAVVTTIYIEGKLVEDHQINCDELEIVSLTSKESTQPILQFSADVFFESKYNNVYFNRKIYIDENNAISNGIECSSKTPSFTDIRDIESLESDAFKDIKSLWNSSKEQTDICSSCELRRMCIDNRIPQFRESDGKWYHTSECNYNPYLAKWKGEEGYLSSEQCGIISNAEEFSVNEALLNQMTRELWAE